jgi:hypothetical protein
MPRSSARGPCTAAPRGDRPLPKQRRRSPRIRFTHLRRELERVVLVFPLRARWATAGAGGNRAVRGACNTDRSQPPSAGPEAAWRGPRARARNGRTIAVRTLGRKGRLRYRPPAPASNPSIRRGPPGPVVRTIRVSYPLIPFRSQRVFVDPRNHPVSGAGPRPTQSWWAGPGRLQAGGCWAAGGSSGTLLGIRSGGRTGRVQKIVRTGVPGRTHTVRSEPFDMVA